MMRDRYISGRLEGSGASRFVQLMSIYGYNEGIRIEIALITKTSPVTFRFGNEPIEIEDDGDSVIIADHLLEHTRTVSIDGAPDVQMVVRSPLKVGDAITVVSTESGQLMYVMDRAII